MIKTEKGELKPYYMSKLKGNFKFVDGSVACDLPMNRMSELFNINTFIVSQVNPHVAPFITSDGFSHDKSRLRRRLLVKARNLIGNEIQHWITQLTYLGLFPEYVQGIADLVMQTYRGHVTIAPRPSLYDYRRLIQDVEPSDFERVLQHTYTQTIQRISHIRSLFGIEREFDRYYMRLKNKLHCQIHLRHDKDLIKFQINKALKEKQLGLMAQNQNARDMERINPIGLQNQSLKLDFDSDRNTHKASRLAVQNKMLELLSNHGDKPQPEFSYEVNFQQDQHFQDQHQRELKSLLQK